VAGVPKAGITGIPLSPGEPGEDAAPDEEEPVDAGDSEETVGAALPPLIPSSRPPPDRFSFSLPPA
jgi:hypothetical protein